jgi:hypothetical protein
VSAHKYGVLTSVGYRNRAHHRTASSTSTRSGTAAPAIPATSVVGITAPAPVRPVPTSIGGISMSRQNSTASRRSRAESPAPLGSSYSQSHSYGASSHIADATAGSGYFHPRNTSGGHALHLASSTAATTASSELSPGLMQGTSRYEETAFFRSELESVKRENDALKRRVRDLERLVRDRRSSDASRTRSESVSTTASVSVAASAGGSNVRGGTNIAGRRDRDRERDRAASLLSSAGGANVEDEVRVGESAASAGLRPQDAARE